MPAACIVPPQPLYRRPWLPAAWACVVWAVASFVGNGGLDGYHDMLENHAWGQHWPLGTHKHPPFFAWVAATWFALVPEGHWAYRVLAYLNVWVGIMGVLALGRQLIALAGLGHFDARFQPHRLVALNGLVVWGALLLMWCLPYTTLAGKFNANTQLLSLWPWVAATMLMSWRLDGWRGWLATLALGVVAAAAMLSKYYSGVFLAGLLAPTLLHAAGRAWLRTLRPYVAVGVFALTLTPHVLWLHAHGWATLAYVGEQGASDGGVDWSHVLRFAAAPILYWLPAWLAVAAIYGWHMHRQQGHRPKTPDTSLLCFCLGWARTTGGLLRKSWRPVGRDDVLFWLAFMPWALTLAFGITGVVELSTPWAIPIGYSFVLLWLRNWHVAAPESSAAVLRSLERAWPRVIVAVVLLGAAVAVHQATRGALNYYRPSAEAARMILNGWIERHSSDASSADINSYPRWVGGAWAESAILGFYANDHILTVPGTPDSAAAQLLDSRQGRLRNWAAHKGLLLCPLGRLDTSSRWGRIAQSADYHAARAHKLPPEVAADACVQNALLWLAARQPDTPMRERRVHLHFVQRELSWRFPRPDIYVYAVLEYNPRPNYSPATRSTSDRFAPSPGAAP